MQTCDLASDPENEKWRAADALEPFDPASNPMQPGPDGLLEGFGELGGHRNSCQLTPTLVDDVMTLTYHAENPCDVTIDIYTLAGGRVWHRVLPDQSGYGSCTIPASGLSFGEYIVAVCIGPEVFPFKILKK